MNEEILISMTLYGMALTALLLRKTYVGIFFFIIYTLQFWPLFFGFFKGEVQFWPARNYIFSASHPVISDLNTLLIATLLGFILSAITMKVKSPLDESIQNISRMSYIPGKLAGYVILILAVAALMLKIVFPGLEEKLNGLDFIVTLLLSASLLVGYVKKDLLVVLSALLMVALYAYHQFVTGDRNFIGIVLSFLMFYLAFCKPNLFRLMLVGAAGVSIFMLGVMIAIFRQEEDISVNTILLFIYYNSWAAVIRPVIDMVIVEGISPSLLFGKTYLDLFLSFAPSPFYSALGIVKPYAADNPAMWYYVTGGGGMHAVGVALKNFGVVGVFFQSWIYSSLLIKLERFSRRKNNLFVYLLYISVVGSLMRSVWYGQIDFVNSVTFWFIFTVFLLFFRFLTTSNTIAR